MNITYAIAIMVAAMAWGAPGRMTAQAHAGTSAQAVSASTQRQHAPQMPRYSFENFTTANGLPNDHVFSVLVDGDRIWAGTENGLAVYENHAWKTYNTADGLAHRAVLSLA